MEMSPQQVKRWAITRKKGRSRYIWVNGVLVWGLGMAFVWPVAMAAVQGWDHILVLLPLSLVIFPVGGYFFGVWTWRWAEAQYERATQENDGVDDEEGVRSRRYEDYE